MIVWAPGLALGLAVEVLAVALALDVAEVVLTFVVAGLGLGFEVEVHPATSNGATTHTTVIKSKYLFTFDPVPLIGSQEAKELP